MAPKLRCENSQKTPASHTSRYRREVKNNAFIYLLITGLCSLQQGTDVLFEQAKPKERLVSDLIAANAWKPVFQWIV
jgi:hypothetical protein